MLSAGLIFGSIKKGKDYSVEDQLKNSGLQGKFALHAKDLLNRTNSMVELISTFIGCTRHLHAQVLPAVKVMAEGTRFSRLALPGLAEAFPWAINLSDFVEFISDSKYVVDGELSHDFSKNRFVTLIAHACVATANVTNTIELVREWGGHQMAFLGEFGNSLASISIYGTKPLAFVAGVSVSGICSATLCSFFFFSAIDSYRRIGHEKRKIDHQTEKKAHYEALFNDPHSNQVAMFLKIQKHEKKLANHEAKQEEAQKKVWVSGAKCALYTTLLGLQVSNVFVLGALGSLAFVTSFSLATYKISVI